MIPVLNRDSNTITVASFYENYKLDKYNFEPAYQRHSVWSEEKQSFFIDSLLKNFPIPPIFLHQHIDDQNGRTMYDVIDGKQRLQSIIRFIENAIPVANEFGGDEFDVPELAGAYFYDLDRPDLSEYKRRFWRYVIPIEYIDTVSGDVIDNIFDRLNRNGEPLTGQELRNAKYHDSPFLRMVQDTAEEQFWGQRLAHVDLARMENDEFISELFFVILEDGGPLEAKPLILDQLYEKYTQLSVQLNKAEAEFHSVTSFLEALNLDYEEFKIKGVSHLYGLWCLAHYCVVNGVSPDPVAEKLKTFLAELRSNEIEDPDVAEYKKTMSARTKSRYQRSKRLEALVNYCGL
jgi:hypothetical protein